MFPGFSLHDELGLLVEAGLTPMEALQAATSGPAEYFGTREAIGTIEPGRAADLVLLEANPLADIRHTKRIAAVIAAGRLIDRSGLEAILGRAERTASLKSIAERLWVTIEKDGLAAALSEYRTLKVQPQDYEFGEDELNSLGYRLLGRKMADAAIAILTLNTEAFPTSANAFDSLGEAYLASGDTERARASYRRSLELDPRNTNAAAVLDRLGGAKRPPR